MSRDPLDFRRWLRDELAVPAASSRQVVLSDLEALAVVLLCIEWQADPAADGCTADIARLLAGALLARLE
jgi:hypothetical protein